MSSYIPKRFSLKRKPEGYTALNRSANLAKGLTTAYVFNEPNGIPRNITGKGALGTASTTKPVTAIKNNERVLDFGTDNRYIDLGKDADSLQLAGSSAATFAWSFVRTASGGTDEETVVANLDSPSTDAMHLVFRYDSANTQWEISIRETGGWISAIFNHTLDLNAVEDCVVVYDGTVKMWVDGQALTNTGGTGTGNPISSGAASANTYLGNQPVAPTTDMWQGYARYFYVWNSRAISEAEVQALNKDPYSVLEAQVRYLPSGIAQAELPVIGKKAFTRLRKPNQHTPINPKYADKVKHFVNLGTTDNRAFDLVTREFGVSTTGEAKEISPLGVGLHFDGADDMIEFDSGLQYQQLNFVVVSEWVADTTTLTQTSTQYSTLANDGVARSGWAFEQQAANNNLNFVIGATDNSWQSIVFPGADVVAGKKYVMVGMLHNEVMKFWVNGVLQGTLTGMIMGVDSGSKLTVGNHPVPDIDYLWAEGHIGLCAYIENGGEALAESLAKNPYQLFTPEVVQYSKAGVGSGDVTVTGITDALVLTTGTADISGAAASTSSAIVKRNVPTTIKPNHINDDAADLNPNNVFVRNLLKNTGEIYSLGGKTNQRGYVKAVMGYGPDLASTLGSPRVTGSPRGTVLDVVEDNGFYKDEVAKTSLLGNTSGFTVFTEFMIRTFNGNRRCVFHRGRATSFGAIDWGIGAYSNRFYFAMYQADGGDLGAYDFDAPILNKWYRIVGTYDGANDETKLYVNGQLKDTADTTGLTPNLTESAMYLGLGSDVTNVRNFDGNISYAGIINDYIASEADAKAWMSNPSGIWKPSTYLTEGIETVVEAPTTVTGITDALVLAEGTATISNDVTITGITDALVLAEGTATVSNDVTVTGITDALVLAEGTADIVRDISVTGITDTLVLAEGTATISNDVIITAIVDTLVLAEGTATIVVSGPITDNDKLSMLSYQQPWNSAIPIGNGSLDQGDKQHFLGQYSGIFWDVSEGTTVTGITDALVLAEGTATISNDVTITGITDALVLAEGTADIIRDITVTGITDTLVLAEGTATISNDVTITAIVDALVLAEGTATISNDVTITAIGDALVLAEGTATVELLVTITGITDALVLAEGTASIIIEGPITDNDKLSMLSYQQPWNSAIPIGNGSLDQGDKQHFLGQYSGIFWEATSGTIVTGITDALVLAEGTAGIVRDITVTGITDALVLAEGTADVVRDITVTGITDALVLAGGTANIIVGTTVTGITDALVLAEGTADIVRDITVTGITDALVLSEGTADIVRDITVTGITDALVLAGGTANIIVGTTVTGITDTLVLTEGTASIVLDRSVLGITDALVLAEGTAEITLDVTITTITDALTLSEGTASILVGTTVVGITDALTLEEGTAAISVDKTITTATAALALLTNPATIIYDVNVQAIGDALVLTEYSATITLAAAAQQGFVISCAIMEPAVAGSGSLISAVDSSGAETEPAAVGSASLISAVDDSGATMDTAINATVELD